MSYSERIKQFRESRKLTHQQFADAVGVSRGAIQQWESGATAPKRPNQPVVAKFMGISVSDLMSDTDATPPAQLPAPTSNKPLSTASVEEGAINSGAKLAESLNVLAQVLCAVPESERDAVSRKLASLAMAPDSAQLLQSLQTALQQAKQAATDHTKPPNNTVRGIAGQVLAQKLTTESTDFQSGRTKV